MGTTVQQAPPSRLTALPGVTVPRPQALPRAHRDQYALPERLHHPRVRQVVCVLAPHPKPPALWAHSALRDALQQQSVPLDPTARQDQLPRPHVLQAVFVQALQQV